MGFSNIREQLEKAEHILAGVVGHHPSGVGQSPDTEPIPPAKNVDQTSPFRDEASKKEPPAIKPWTCKLCNRLNARYSGKNKQKYPRCRRCNVAEGWEDDSYLIRLQDFYIELDKELSKDRDGLEWDCFHCKATKNGEPLCTLCGTPYHCKPEPVDLGQCGETASE